MTSKTVAALLSYRIKSCKKKKTSCRTVVPWKIQNGGLLTSVKLSFSLFLLFLQCSNEVFSILSLSFIFLSSLSPVLNTFQPFMVSNIVCYFIKMSIPSIN